MAAALFVIVWIDSGGFPIITALLSSAAGVGVVTLAARWWESSTAPQLPAFSQLRGEPDGGVELQQDDNAGLWTDGRGFLWSRRVWFAGTQCPPRRINTETYRRLRAWHDRGDLPVFIARSRERQWWWWRNAFYWESGDYEPAEVHALLAILDRDDPPSVGDGNGSGSTNALEDFEPEDHLRRAEPIPEHIKRFVFERDHGRCVRCGSPELVQYDHVNPLLYDRGNEPGNLQLLCAGCSRRKARELLGSVPT